MTRFMVLALALVVADSMLVSQSVVQAVMPAQANRGNITGHVWFDADCDGIKDAGEGNVPNAGVVQVVNTGSDHVLTPGDRAQTYYTDAQGHWQATLTPIGVDDLPVVFAIAVGEGTAAGLGYTVSPDGGDSILAGPTHASATFQVEAGVTKQVGEIGLCSLSTSQNIKVYLPMLQH